MSDLLLELMRHIRDIERAIERLGAVEADGTRPCAGVYNSANISLSDAAVTVLGMDSEYSDTHAQHFTSAANLTGTVTKTATSAALVGVGTLFLTELSIGQVISVPGTATEKRVVIAITDNTHLTVNAVFANNAAGQTATRVNSALVCRVAGQYDSKGGITFAANATGSREARLVLNDATIIGRCKIQAVSVAGEGTALQVVTPRPVPLALWDFVELAAVQGSGGALTVLTLADYSPALGWARVG